MLKDTIKTDRKASEISFDFDLKKSLFKAIFGNRKPRSVFFRLKQTFTTETVRSEMRIISYVAITKFASEFCTTYF